MPTVELTAENFADTIESNDIVLIDFWAEWCPPCKIFEPVYEKVSEDHPDVVFARCNTEEQQTLASQFQIMSIPTLMAIREKVIIFSQAGALPQEVLEQLVSKIKELDMDDVRARIAEQEAKQGDQPQEGKGSVN